MKRLIRILSSMIAASIIGVSLVAATPAQAATSNGARTYFYLSGTGVTGPWIGDYTIKTAYLGKNARLKIYFDYHSIYYGHSSKPRLTLQRKTGATWRTVTATVHNNAKGIYVTTPKYAMSSSLKTKTVYYRLKSTAYSTDTNQVVNTTHSPSAKFIYENQSLYTGLKKTIYGYAKAYCPNSAIHIADLGGDEAGLYKTGTYLIRIDSKVGNYPIVDQKSVALHECGHEREYFNYGGDYYGWQAMKVDAAKYFTDDETPEGVEITPAPAGAGDGSFSPLEHAADCAALSVNPDGYLGYGGYCNPSELSHGHQLLLGYKF